jgi:hypothetical protein
MVRQAIYLVEDGILTPAWRAGHEGRIDVTGNTVPVPVAGWNGILFSTRAGGAKGPTFHLLYACPQNGN